MRYWLEVSTGIGNKILKSTSPLTMQSPYRLVACQVTLKSSDFIYTVGKDKAYENLTSSFLESFSAR